MKNNFLKFPMSMTIEKNKIKLVVLNCITPLLLGGLIYIMFRSTTLRMFEWFSLIGLEDAIQSARTSVFEFKNYLPKWAYFSLPDGLWIYSFTSAILIYWDNDNQKTKRWLLIPFTTGILIEILQAFKLFPGTFDYLDLTFSIFGLSLSKIIINNKFKQNDKQRQVP
jgi:hypothetical protein